MNESRFQSSDSVRSGAPLPAAEKLALPFQACDDSSCLPPETVELAVP